MKLITDLFPIVCFFIAYKWGDIYLATKIIIVTTFIQTLWSRITTGRFQKLHVMTFMIVSVLGGATLLLHNDAFIKWKPTVVYWLLALSFLVTQYFGKKSLLQHMTGDSLQLPQKAWQQLNISWVIFFTLMGIANLYIAYRFTTDIWVNFKLFGTLGLTLVFIVLQGLYIGKIHDSNTTH